ncbi:DNA-packaging protein [Sphingomonas psychrotolerans]|uniref:ATP-binding protein n=1 Tax=Sphingomonas psychrotolerans TaxID=1327635 RepID=A0A2K8MHK1_9SPHN|nr:terminase family protein [Sphingomonas psychrotolerans]ATY33333.1 ATP-binding protein [Sphingomonas psychrotolerans]
MTPDPAAAEDMALLRALAALPLREWPRVLARLNEAQSVELVERFPIWAHNGQLDPGGDPLVWLIMAGRGFGKTRAGAEWLSALARQCEDGRFALVGATRDDVRRVMVEGPSGLLAVAREDEAIVWTRDRGEVRFASGAIAFAYSAEAAEALRGPEHHAAWCDEIGKWGRGGDAAWDNLMFGLRLATRPRVLVTTTPKPTALVRRVQRLANKDEASIRGRTADNPNLPADFVAAMLATYAGTRLARQELDGELLEDVAGALWTRRLIERARISAAPELVRVVVGVDPPASAEGDACGIVAVGLGRDGCGYVLEDATVAGASPEGWARAVVACAARHAADRVVAEKNQGGDMVASVLRGADSGLPVRLVHASRGKSARAEPVAMLYEAGKARHAGAFPELEDELCGLQAGGGYEGPGRSPDRADALVWAMTELMLGKRGAARVTVM